LTNKVTDIISGTQAIVPVTNLTNKVTDIISGTQAIVPVTNIINGTQALVPVTNIISGAQAIVPVTNIISGAQAIVPVTNIINGTQAIVLNSNSTGTTQASTDNSNKLATTAFVKTASSSSPIGIFCYFFTSSGTFTIPDGVTAIKVTLVGGGGGGGSALNTCGVCYLGGDGGFSATSLVFLSGLTPGNTLSVIVGAGGGGAPPHGGNGGQGGTSQISSGTQSITTCTAPGGKGGNPDNNIGSESNYGIGATFYSDLTYFPYGKGGAGGNTRTGGISGKSGFVLIEW
jgi:hypothetical protein